MNENAAMGLFGFGLLVRLEAACQIHPELNAARGDEALFGRSLREAERQAEKRCRAMNKTCANARWFRGHEIQSDRELANQYEQEWSLLSRARLAWQAFSVDQHSRKWIEYRGGICLHSTVYWPEYWAEIAA